GTVTTAATFNFKPTASGFYDVTLTATDKDNGSTMSSPFTVNATPIARVINFTGVPAIPTGGTLPTTTEGVLLHLASNIPASAGVHFTYAWSVTLDGQPFTPPTGTPTSLSSFDFKLSDSGTFQFTLSVVGDDGSTATNSVTVIAANVPP